MADMATVATTTTTRRTTRAERAAYRRRCTAYHEAGHAVAVLAVTGGRRFRYVTIVADPKDESCGHCAFTRWPRTMDPDTTPLERLEPILRKEILVMLSGGAAEAQFRGRRDYVSAVDDYVRAEKYARWAMGCHRLGLEFDGWSAWCERCEWSKRKSDCDVYLRRLWMNAVQLVERAMPAITALVEALLERETLRYAEACDIVRDRQFREA